VSDRRVGDGDGQRQTDVSESETDSVRQTCRRRRRTASGGRVVERQTALDEHHLNRENGGNGGNGGEVDIPNRIQEVA